MLDDQLADGVHDEPLPGLLAPVAGPHAEPAAHDRLIATHGTRDIARGQIVSAHMRA
ncbi:MAG: hypothetical protein ACRDLN_10510 [Solirubrobacteraceae bacterium]